VAAAGFMRHGGFDVACRRVVTHESAAPRRAFTLTGGGYGVVKRMCDSRGRVAEALRCRVCCVLRAVCFVLCVGSMKGGWSGCEKQATCAADAVVILELGGPAAISFAAGEYALCVPPLTTPVLRYSRYARPNVQFRCPHRLAVMCSAFGTYPSLPYPLRYPGLTVRLRRQSNSLLDAYFQGYLNHGATCHHRVKPNSKPQTVGFC
jgi:hypothetical protein